jgi:adenosylcobinamide-GDP ribazoletransferase
VVIGAAVAVLVPVGIGLSLVRRAREVVGGITGDVLGAAVELGLAAALLTLALAA